MSQSQRFGTPMCPGGGTPSITPDTSVPYHCTRYKRAVYWPSFIHPKMRRAGRSVRRTPMRLSGRKRAALTRSYSRRVRPRTLVVSPSYNLRSPVPETINVRLKYMDYFTMDPSVVGGPAQYKYAANGLYDPNVSGAGHQPRGFDQLMGLYQRYTVVASTIRLTAPCGTTSDNSSCMIIGCWPCNVLSPVINDWLDAFEQQGWRSQKTISNATSAATPAGGLPTLSNYVDIALQLGKKDLIDDDSCSGDATQNPSDLVYWQILYGTTSGTAELSAVSVIAELTFLVTFSRPANVLAS